MNEPTANVLIVDDVMENIQVVMGHLREEGYDLLFATDGPSALEATAAGGVDLLLLDVMMPGMDGFEVCRRLKADPRTRDVPVIFLTAKTEPAGLLQGFAAGGVDYIAKPFNPPELLARVRTHLQLRRHERELRSLVASKDRFLSILAEDLRAPFGGLEGMLKRLARDHRQLSQPQLDDYLHMAAQTAESIAAQVSNLLSWARLQTGVFGCRPEPLEAGAQLAEAVLLAGPDLRAKDIQLTLEAGPPVPILADPAMLESLLGNLLSNAIKFTPRGGRITVAARADADGGVLEVIDNGAGIPAADLSKLFRLETSSRRLGTEGETGIGMGLIVARGLAEQQGGRIELWSSEGAGTRCRVVLPAPPAAG
jgi:two-component system, sensor histidine kinase and response regulator